MDTTKNDTANNDEAFLAQLREEFTPNPLSPARRVALEEDLSRRIHRRWPRPTLLASAVLSAGLAAVLVWVAIPQPVTAPVTQTAGLATPTRDPANEVGSVSVGSTALQQMAKGTASTERASDSVNAKKSVNTAATATAAAKPSAAANPSTPESPEPEAAPAPSIWDYDLVDPTSLAARAQDNDRPVFAGERLPPEYEAIALAFLDY